MKTKKIFLYFFILTSTLIFAVAIVFFFFNKEKEETLKNALNIQQQNSLRLITDQLYGDLLIDNTLEAERKLNLLIAKNVIINFSIQKGQLDNPSSDESFCEVIYFDKESRQGAWGTLCVRFSSAHLKAGTINLKGVTTIVMFLSLFFILVILYIFRQISNMNNKLFQGVELALTSPEKKLFNDDLWEPVLGQLRAEVQKKNQAEELLLKKQFETEKIKITHQVAHDIRSPLAALKMALGGLDSIPADYRLVIQNSVQRINEIANNLLSSNKDMPKEHEILQEDQLLFDAIDSLVSEKRMEFSDRQDITIISDFDADHKLTVKINKAEFHRVLSNLINNSIESMAAGGRIAINVSERETDLIIITIADTGQGMPKHVLDRLGEPGVSHGKSGKGSGSGLGVHHAKATVESFGGTFKVDSTVGVGTTISILLPKRKL